MTGIFQILAGGGAAAKIPIALTISANTSNYNIYDNRGGTYVAGNSKVTLTINSGVVVFSTSTGSPALTTGSSWTTGDEITIVNNGTILGRGGTGGNGALTGGTGGGGGGALQAQFAVSVDNQNRIAGGGGGGGGGASSSVAEESGTYSAGGGGGGGGIGNGTGGSGGSTTGPFVPGQSNGSAGQSGTLTAAGNGGNGGAYPFGPAQPFPGGVGGAGGTYGSSGSTGANAYAGQNGGPGGGGGFAISGNSNITWINFGTRNGSIT
jgi:hypothetical protein